MSWRGGGRYSCRTHMTIDPRIPTMPGWSTSGFHGPGRHKCAQSAKWWGGDEARGGGGGGDGGVR